MEELVTFQVEKRIGLFFIPSPRRYNTGTFNLMKEMNSNTRNEKRIITDEIEFF